VQRSTPSQLVAPSQLFATTGQEYAPAGRAVRPCGMFNDEGFHIHDREIYRRE